MFNRFLLGSIQIDKDVSRVLGRHPLDMVARHAVSDYGLVSARRWKQNDLAYNSCGEIQSIYHADPNDPSAGYIVVTTKSGWGSTHVTWRKWKP